MATDSLIRFEQWPWQHWMSMHPDATAIVRDDAKISWQTLCADIDSVHFDVSLQTAAPIAVLSDNHYDTLVLMLAAWQRGLTTLMLNPAFPDRDRNDLLTHIGIDSLVTTPSGMMLNTSVNAPVFDYDAQRCLTLTLTSGSSGRPKAVAHTAENHLASATGLFSLMPFESSDCWLLSLPLFHISGLAIVWRWLAKGAVLKVADTRGEKLVTALDGVTHASLVPTQLERLVRGGKPASLHSVLLGGAVIPQHWVDQAEKQGIRCWCGYGMTEMASTITAKRADGYFSVGKPLPYRELMLSSNGEVLVNGKTLSPGYMIDGELVPLTRGWFQTKDKASWCTANHDHQDLQIMGRLDNMFICGGENVQPETVERALIVFDGIKQLFVLPLADKTWGQVPVALIEGECDAQDFLAWAKTQVPPYQCPQRVFVLPTHLLASGIKVSRNALSDWLNSKMTESTVDDRNF
ncbi:o-succinylbenzoate--CoA ligase [Enterovibrio sp. 27052020O]|uniref:o-succinylbenzoate--CoA ligase n=1 Tax=Enterovibrio sp. 27052020O TaxID=3241166 RepID=UPI00389049E5